MNPLLDGFLVFASFGSEQIKGIVNAGKFYQLILPSGIKRSRSKLSKSKTRILPILVQDNEGGLHFFILKKSGKSVSQASIVGLDDEHGAILRCPEIQQLKSCSVALVGLGSVGSKIAEMLCRIGVRRFILVDDDIVLPENLVRHTADWSSVGSHKVDAVGRQLQLLASDVYVEKRKLLLTGQHESTEVEEALEKILGCDVIVDATADSATFSLLGYVAARERTAMVWLEVYGGGYGGMIGRYRPGKDPEPLLIRRQVHLALEDLEPAPESQVNVPYGTVDDQGLVMIADDAEVTILASHACRLVLDILLEHEPSRYSNSVYLVGLERRWIFRGPFDVRPIRLREEDS